MLEVFTGQKAFDVKRADPELVCNDIQQFVGSCMYIPDVEFFSISF